MLVRSRTDRVGNAGSNTRADAIGDDIYGELETIPLDAIMPTFDPNRITGVQAARSIWPGLNDIESTRGGDAR